MGRQGSPGIVSNSKESYIEAGPVGVGGTFVLPLIRGAGGIAGTAIGRGGSTVLPLPPPPLSVPLLLTLLLVEPVADIGGKAAAAAAAATVAEAAGPFGVSEFAEDSQEDDGARCRTAPVAV